MKVVVVGSLPESLINFRGPLLKAMVARGHSVTACAPDISLEVGDALVAMGVEYRSVSLQRAGLNFFHDLKSVAALFRLFRTTQPDLVLFYTIKPVLYGTLAAWLADVPASYSMITGLGYSFSKGGNRQAVVGFCVRIMYRLLLQRNRKVFFQNPDDRQLFLDRGLLRDSAGSVLINGSGVDLDFFPKTALPKPVSFLMIARLLTDKGVREYVAAARLLGSKYPGIRFRLVGWIDKNPLAVSHKELDDWQKEGVIEFLGYLEDVRPALAASSVYVLPSYREGTPRTVLEAMAMGRPIITTDAPGCRETVLPGKNGYLVPIRDVEALATAMEKFLDDPALVTEMGTVSRTIAENRYDVHKVNAVLLDTMGL